MTDRQKSFLSKVLVGLIPSILIILLGYVATAFINESKTYSQMKKTPERVLMLEKKCVKIDSLSHIVKGHIDIQNEQVKTIKEQLVSHDDKLNQIIGILLKQK